MCSSHFSKRSSFSKTIRSERKTCGTSANKLKFKYVPEGCDVIAFGEYGSEFFILLHGNVSVLIPAKNKEPEKDKASQHEAKQSEDSSISEDPPSDQSSDGLSKRTNRPNRRAAVVAALDKRRKSINPNLLFPHRGSEIQNRRQSLLVIKQGAQNAKFGALAKIQEHKEERAYNEVAVLPAGSSFGELALISSKPRAATIRTKCNSYFAVLEKEDYNKVYGVIQEKLLNEKIDFFKSLPVFSDWTRISVAKLTYFFYEKEFKRNHVVFQEGDPSRFCFIVIEGEFEATKKVILGSPRK